jgi:hypothetical protein
MSEVKVNKISPRTNCGTTQLGDAGDTITVTGDLKSNSIKISIRFYNYIRTIR